MAEPSAVRKTISMTLMQILTQEVYIMRYAVPVSGGVVATHFGHCEHFALVDVDEGESKIVGKELVPSLGHQPGLLPQ